MTYRVATEVTETSPGSYHAEAQPDWDIFGITNGGYLMAMAGRAMSQTSGGRLPVTVTAHFLRPTSAGEVEIAVEELKRGRTMSTLSAEIRSAEGMALVTLLGTTAEPDRPTPSVRLNTLEPISMPPPEDCLLAVPSPDGPLPPPIVGKFQLRVHPEDAYALMGRPSGQALVRGWFRLHDGEAPDPFLPLLVADAFPPAIFNTDLALGWTPTVEMTTHIRSGVGEGWLRCSFETRFIGDGILEEDGHIWDESGGLVAESRQLALVPN
jgi:Acyl-CoA thioesterase C-terminal domain/Acyl-CoA thioesterase N-terminal domain